MSIVCLITSQYSHTIGAEAQLPAGHCCVIVVPEVIAHGAPGVVIADLYPPR